MLGKTSSFQPRLPLPKIAIYSYTYVDYATVHSYATLQSNRVLLRTTDFHPLGDFLSYRLEL